MKKVAKAMYGKSMMKNGGMKKMADGGGVGKSQASGGKGSISDMTPNSSSGVVNGPNTIYAPGKKKTESTKTYKTGGMVNSNAKILVDKTPGSKGTKVGLNPKAGVTPKAKYGMSMKPGMMKMGGTKKK
jgi:hypothetical protein